MISGEGWLAIRSSRSVSSRAKDGTGTGIRTPVPWLRIAAGDLDGLRLRRFCWGFRTDLPAVAVVAGRFRGQSFKFFSSPGGPSLVTNADDLTGLHDPEGVENLRHERTQLLHTVRAGHRYHDGNAARAQVLLKREVPIDREKRLEVLGNHQVQKFTVALGRPTQINDVMCVVAGQFTQQRPRHTLIEQQAKETSVDPLSVAPQVPVDDFRKPVQGRLTALG